MIQAMNDAELSSEQQKLVKATMINVITQANQKLNINFEKPKKRYQEI